MKVFPKFIIPVIVIVSAGAIFSVVTNKKNSSVTDEEQAVCITTSVNSETASEAETENSSITSETVISDETDITTVSNANANQIEETSTVETNITTVSVSNTNQIEENTTDETTITSTVQTSESNSGYEYNPSDIVGNLFNNIDEFDGWKIEDKKCDIVKFNDNPYGEIYISSDKKNVIFFNKNEWYIKDDKEETLRWGDYDDGGRKRSIYTSDNNCISAYIYKLKATSPDKSICKCWIFHISGDTKYGGWYYVSKIY